MSQSDFSRIVVFEKSWSKRSQAFGPQGARMDTRMLSFTASCAWRLLCDMPSAQGSGDGVGTPPGHCWDAAYFSADFVRSFA